MCKEKKREYDKIYRKLNRDKINERHKRYYQNNKEKFCELRKKSYDPQKEAIRKKINFEKNKNFLIEKELLTDCIICGFSKENFIAIDFHHINPDEKENEISNLIQKGNQEKLYNEAKKCVCMCRNCHALYHGNDPKVVEKFNKIIEQNQ